MIILKMNIRNIFGCSGLEVNGSGQAKIAGCFGHGYELLCSVIAGNVLFKMDTEQCCFL
jgi:hypothetical protein